MKKILFPFFLVVSVANAQPTLTGANSNPVIGEHFYDYPCHVGGVDPGPGGAGITWNFSSLADSIVDTISIVSCLSTPYCDSMASSTHVKIAHNGNFYMGHYSDAFVFDLVGYTDIGFGAPYNVFYERPYRLLKYPMTYGDSWHDTGLLRVPSNNHQHTFVSQYHNADGYGTLITPTGTYPNVLRVHVTNYTADTFFMPGGPPALQWERFEDYFWYTPGYHEPLLWIEIVKDSEDNFTFVSTAVFSSAIPLSVTGKELTGTETLVYPNPASDILHIKTPMNNYTAKLFDLMGRAVAIEEKNVPANNYGIDVSHLPPGLYLLQLQNADGIITKKIEISQKP